MEDDALNDREFTGLEDGSVLEHHPASVCEGRHCCIHNPSDHPMRNYPKHWRDDRRMMERICPHGVGHPDPDDLAWHAHSAMRIYSEVKAEEIADARDVHECDGCCKHEEETNEAE